MTTLLERNPELARLQALLAEAVHVHGRVAVGCCAPGAHRDRPDAAEV